MTRRSSEPDFIESLARGLDVLGSFRPREPVLSLGQVAGRTGLARPTARRILLTLTELGYVRPAAGGFALTPRVLDLGTTYVQSLGLWEVARPHLDRLVEQTHESSSIAQLDGPDIVYVARVAVPKIVGLAVGIGTRFPATVTSLGKVLLAALAPTELAAVLAQPSRSGVTPRVAVDSSRLAGTLREVSARGWAVTDEELAAGIRSVAVPLRDGEGHVVAAVNVNAHAAETSLATLLDHHLPPLLAAAEAIAADWGRLHALPIAVANTG